MKPLLAIILIVVGCGHRKENNITIWRTGDGSNVSIRQGDSLNYSMDDTVVVIRSNGDTLHVPVTVEVKSETKEIK